MGLSWLVVLLQDYFCLVGLLRCFVSCFLGDGCPAYCIDWFVYSLFLLFLLSGKLLLLQEMAVKPVVWIHLLSVSWYDLTSFHATVGSCFRMRSCFCLVGLLPCCCWCELTSFHATVGSTVVMWIGAGCFQQLLLFAWGRWLSSLLYGFVYSLVNYLILLLLLFLYFMYGFIYYVMD